MVEKDLNLDFCRKFNYPDEVRSLLKEIVDILTRKEVVSIIALGSLPRGELSYRRKDGILELFSDIDLYVVTKSKVIKSDKESFLKNTRDLGHRFQPKNPLFEINIEFFILQDFKKLPFRVRHYETRESGEVLFGQDIKNIIMRFNQKDQDLKDTNNIILRRLFHILLYLPGDLIEGKGSDFKQDIFKYVVARNCLDIATVLLFQRGIFITTYRDRVEYIASNSNEFIDHFGKDFPDFLIRCLNVKLNMDFSQSLASLFEDALKYFKLLLVYTLENNGIGLKKRDNLLPLIERSKVDIFGEANITRTKFEFILKSSNFQTLLKRLNALSYSFLGSIIFYFLDMNESALLHLKGDRRSLSILDDSWWILMRLGILNGKESIPSDFVNRFLVLRKKFFFDFHVKFESPEGTERIEKLINWRYE